jgi:hypothetical protein
MAQSQFQGTPPGKKQKKKKKTMEEELRLYEERIYALYRQTVDF